MSEEVGTDGGVGSTADARQVGCSNEVMRIFALVMLFVSICLWPSTFAQQTYKPPEVTSAGDAYTSYNIVFDGLFALDIGLSDEGDIRRIEALRDPGPMLDVAKTSVHTWKFQPASEGRKPRASRLTVALVYRPANYPTFGAVPPKDFAPVIPSAHADDGSEDYIPVGILPLHGPPLLHEIFKATPPLT